MLAPRADGGVNLVREAPAVRTLVLPGGGAKGVSYVGLMRVMKEDGAFAGVERLAGSSAGALAATVMAFTDDDKSMQDMLADELPTLLDTRAELRTTYPGLSFHNTMSTGARAIWKMVGKPLGEANGLVRKLDEITGNAAKEFLDQAFDSKAADEEPGESKAADSKVADGKSESKASALGLSRRIATYAQRHGLDIGDVNQRFATLRQAPDFDSDRTGGMITFRDAALLQHLAPDRFRTVEVTAYAPETGDIHYFNAESTPDMPLAYATRASMSHPLLATGVQIDDGPVLIDGGLRTNMPSEVVVDADMDRAMGEPSAADEKTRAQTVVLQFDNTVPKDPATPPRPQRSAVARFFSSIGSFFSSIPRRFMSWFMDLVSLNPNSEADRNADRTKFASAGANGLLLRYGKLRTTDMNVSKQLQEDAIAQAAASIREQLRDRQNQAWHVHADSAEAAYAMLGQEEKDAILLAGPPEAPDTAARDAARDAVDNAETEVLCAKAGVDEDVLEDAEKELSQARRRLDHAENDFRHALKRRDLAIRLHDIARQEMAAQSPTPAAARV